MQIYLNAVFNHFRTLQAWAADKDARLSLDVKSFEVEVKFRGRYYAMYPMFQGRTGGRSAHTSALPQNVVGFGGWRPYQPLRHPHSTDKRLFKSFLVEEGLRTPASRPALGEAQLPEFDYLLKGAVGSFGQEIAGPFRAGALPSEEVRRREGATPGNVFVEEFVRGDILKVWFWGDKPFFVHSHAYPVIAGDGASSVEQLVREKVRRAGQQWDDYPDRDVVVQCLRFQNTELQTVLAASESRWIDYRYAQRYERVQGVTSQSDNALADLMSKAGDQLDRMGKALVKLLRQTLPAPVMISVDGMLDASGNIWWLEMNTNSVVPPEAYPVMFSDLFY